MFHPFTGEIYGAQAVGKEEVDKRIDVIAMVIQRGMTIKGTIIFYPHTGISYFVVVAD